ncbi:MAG: hypothetical protein HXY34_06765 [Candidatus Thorarchaeota archaeon]|nr:hypothetical protein [Candidatus Thorarchaeota archaeon]
MSERLPARLALVLFLCMSAVISFTGAPPSQIPRDATVLSNGTEPIIYRGGTIDTVRVIAYASLEDALSAVNDGEADVFGLMVEREHYTLIDSYPNLERQWSHDTRACAIVLNAQAYPLHDSHLRRAIAFAVNKTMIRDVMGTVDLADFAVPLSSEYSPESKYGGLFYDRDIAHANAELGMAGILDVDENGYVEAPNGSSLTLRLTYPYDVYGMNETAQLISNDLLSVGINNTLVPLDSVSLQTGLANHSLDFELALCHMEFPLYDADWAIRTFHSSMVSVAGENIARVSDPQINSMVGRLLANSKLSAMHTLVYEGLQLIRDLCPIIPLFFYNWLSVYSTANLDGWNNHTSGGAYSVWNPVTLAPKTGKPSQMTVAVLPSFFSDFFRSLNPLYQCNNVSWTPIDSNWYYRRHFNPYLLVYDSLTATHLDGTAVPRLSTYWEVQFSDQKPDIRPLTSRAVFYCDPAANWTDGTRLTAQDVRFSMELYRNLSAIEDAEIIESVKVTGSHTAGVNLNSTLMYHYRVLGSLPVLPLHIMGGMNSTQVSAWNPTPAEAIGSGPYKFAELVLGEELTLTRNTGYYPQLDMEPPRLTQIYLSPQNPIPAETVTVRAYLDDRSRIANVSLSWTSHVGTLNFTTETTMQETSQGYVGIIPASITSSSVNYSIRATDIWGNSAVLATGLYPQASNGGIGAPDLTIAVLVMGAIGLAATGLVARHARQRG